MEDRRAKIFVYSIVLLFFLGFLAFAIQEKKDELQQELETGLSEKHKKWLNEEVIYIISENEKDVFKSLRTHEERENFIRLFWNRRDPTPETPLNEYREEHYRRIQYANDRFFEGKPGWRTDRGRIYIMFGPPDFFETNPGGARGFMFGAQAPTAEFPSEIWTYRHIAGLKSRVGRIDMTFVDYYATGSYQLTTVPGLANALRNVSLPARYAGYDDIPDDSEKPSIPGQAAEARQLFAMNEMEQLQLLAELTKSRGEVLEELERSSRLRRLKGIVDSRVSMSQVTFIAQESYLKGSGGSTYIPLSVEVAAKDLAFEKVDDRYRGLVNFHVEVRNDRGTTIHQTSERLEMNLREETYQRRLTDFYQYKHGFTLRPGVYYLNIVLWDEFNGNVGYVDRKIEVPSFPDDAFSASEIILARGVQVIEKKAEEIVMETKDIPALAALEKTNLKVPEKVTFRQEESGPFIFGNLDINPNTKAEYPRGSELVFFYQIYSPTFDEAQNTAKIKIEHQILKGDEVLMTIGQPEEVQIPAEQKTAGLNSGAKYNLGDLSPGNYTLVARVTDLFSEKIIVKKVNFRIR